MGLFTASSNDFSAIPGNSGSKIYSALKKAIEGYDYNSGWISKPSNGIVNHGLSVLPKFVQIQGSDSSNGDPFLIENPTAVSSSQITIGGSKAYYRVLANR